MMTAIDQTELLPPTLGAVLAGGRASRMGGGDKPMRQICGQTILERVIVRLAPQCDGVIVNANGDPARFAGLGLPVVGDTVAGQPGPLGGILAALEWCAAQRPDLAWVLSAPGDCPFLPHDLVARLHAAACENEAPVAVAASDGQTHPIIALWHVGLRTPLRHALTVEDDRKAGRFVMRHGAAVVAWPTTPVDPFFNVNTVEHLREAEQHLRAIDQHGGPA